MHRTQGTGPYSVSRSAALWLGEGPPLCSLRLCVCELGHLPFALSSSQGGPSNIGFCRVSPFYCDEIRLSPSRHQQQCQWVSLFSKP